MTNFIAYYNLQILHKLLHALGVIKQINKTYTTDQKFGVAKIFFNVFERISCMPAVT